MPLPPPVTGLTLFALLPPCAPLCPVTDRAIAHAESLEGPGRGASRYVGADGKWDQFAANEEMFGVPATFDEEMYTTKLDKEKSKISEAEAARLAAEIEGATTSNPHIRWASGPTATE